MSERRSHWTDDLIEAVYAELPAKKYQVEPDSWEVHRIIAAVEDWQKRQDIGGDWGTVAWSVRMYQHYVTSEAAIARVRIEHRSDMAGIPWCYACDASWPCDTIRALDGDA